MHGVMHDVMRSRIKSCNIGICKPRVATVKCNEQSEMNMKPKSKLNKLMHTQRAVASRLARLCALTLTLAATLTLSGCGGSQLLWQVYQEPTPPGELPEPSGANELRIVWRSDIGAGAYEGYAILSPVYVGDSVYASGRRSVARFKQQNGEQVWRRDFDGNIFSGVGANRSIVVVAFEDGGLLAMNTNNGRTAWRSTLNRPIAAVPTVVGGRVFVRTTDDMLSALSAKTGDVLWSYESNAPELSVHGASKPAVGGDKVYTGLANGKLIANEIADGRELWQADISAPGGRNELERLTDLDAPPMLVGDRLYTATYQGSVAALRREDGSVIWKADVSSRLPMALSKGRLIVTEQYGEIVALSAADGRELWRQEGFRGHGMSMPLTIGSRVLVGDSAGRVYVLDARSGALLQVRQVFEGAVAALSIASLSRAGEYILAFSSGASLIALQHRSTAN